MIDNRLFARLSWLFPIVSVHLSMIVYALGPNHRAFPYFISESAHPSGPEGWIFLLTLVFSGLLLIITAWRLYNHTKDIAIRPKVTFIAMLIGVFSGSNMILVGIFDIYSSPVLHVITALNLFYGSLGWGILSYVGIYGNQNSRSRMRLYYLGATILCHLVMSYAMTQAFLENPEALTPPIDLNLVQHWVRWAALAEYGFFISSMLLIWSYESEIRGTVDDSEE
ncbi:MAG: DUF998 domain-containing protein [Candidatus Poseidoniales archaeon]|jgi:hypothetical membrane protein